MQIEDLRTLLLEILNDGYLNPTVSVPPGWYTVHYYKELHGPNIGTEYIYAERLLALVQDSDGSLAPMNRIELMGESGATLNSAVLGIYHEEELPADIPKKPPFIVTQGSLMDEGREAVREYKRLLAYNEARRNIKLVEPKDGGR